MSDVDVKPAKSSRLRGRRRGKRELEQVSSSRRVGSLQTAGPVDARRRSMVGLSAGAVVAVIGGVVAAWAFMTVDEREPVLVAGRDLQPGEPIESGVLRVEQMAASGGVPTVDSDDVDSLVGMVPVGPVPEGTPISREMLIEGSPLEDGEMVAGAVLEDGEVPTGGLRAGDRVELLRVTEDEGVASSIGFGTVWSFSSFEDGGGSLAARVDREVGLEMAAASADGRLRVVLTSQPTRDDSGDAGDDE